MAPEPAVELMATCWSSAGDARRTGLTCAARCPSRERVEAAFRSGLPSASGCCPTTSPPPSRSTGYPASEPCSPTTGWSSSSSRASRTGGTRRCTARSPTGCGAMLLEAAEVLAPRTSRSPPTGTPAVGPRPRGRRSSPSSRPSSADVAGWASSSSRGPTSARCTSACSSSRMPSRGGGVIIDASHVARAGTPASDLASVPLHRIVGVELDDADEQRGLDPLRGHRAPPAVLRRGRLRPHSHSRRPAHLRWDCPSGVEILSVEHRSLPVCEALSRAA